MVERDCQPVKSICQAAETVNLVYVADKNDFRVAKINRCNFFRAWHEFCRDAVTFLYRNMNVMLYMQQLPLWSLSAH